MRVQVITSVLACTILLGSATALAQDNDKNDQKPTTITLHIRDYCDPVSFGSLCNRSTTSGAITFNGFLAELSADKSVGAWRFAPDRARVREGAIISFQNLGGEAHTFTRVKKFGGGIVAGLNAASGNTTVAPECGKMVNGNVVPNPSVMFLAPGATGTATVGEDQDAKFQCCIHPWMRMTVKGDEHQEH